VRDHDIDKELSFHLEQQTQAHIAQGLAPAAAARQARLEFGGVAQAREACRAVYRWRVLDTILADIRFAGRLALKTPTLTLTTILTLAIGIGASTTILAFVNAVLVRPLPYADPDALVVVWNSVAQDNRQRNPLSPADYRDFARSTRTLDSLEAYFSFVSPLNIVVDQETEIAYAQTVTSGLFPMLGRLPAVGRPFRVDTDEPAAILSHSYWLRRFGGNPAVVGRAVQLGGQAATIVGVMPPDFVFPYPGMLGPSGFTRITSIDMWVSMVFTGPLAIEQRTIGEDGQLPRNVRWLGAIGRRRSTATVEQVRSDLAAVARQLEETYPASNKGWGATVVTAIDQTVGEVRPALLLLLASVALLLLIATVNVASLMLSRSLERQTEQATRVALGANRARVVQQAIVENLLIALTGGALGLLVATGGVRLLVWLAPQDLPRIAEVSLDWRVAGVTLIVSLVAGVCIGLLPAARAGSIGPRATLQEGGRGTTAGRLQQRWRAALVVTEVALAVVLTISAGLLLRSFATVLAVHPGFTPDHLLTWQMNLPQRLRTADDRRGFYRDLFDRLQALPGVVAVGGTTRLPLGSTSVTTSVDIQSKPRPVADLPEVQFRRNLHGYFEAMGIPIRRGRGFSDDDGPNAPPVVVINETMARQLFAGMEPLGQRVRIGPSGNGPWMEVVGIIGDVRHNDLEEPPAPEMYIHYLQNPPVAPFLVIRTAGDPAALIEPVRTVARTLDKDLPLYDMHTMMDLRAASVARRQFVVLLVTLFGVIALVLAAVGLDGVMSVAVHERMHEMGVRLALGAEPRQLWQMVLGEATRLTTFGIVLGLALTLLAVPMIRSQLFGVRAADPLTLVGGPLLLLAIALAAAFVPALRAAHTDPVQALRVT
jgi:putative ABC transport system permease protein